MPTGRPDYDNPNYSNTNNNVDVTNLFSMLYGFAPVDLNGRVRYFDMFQAGRRGWTESIVGTGVAPKVEINDPYVFHGGGSMYFSVPTVNDESHIEKSFYRYGNARFGVETGFRMSSDMCTFEVTGRYRKLGSNYMDYGLRLNGDTFELQLYTDSGWETLDDYTLGSGTSSVWGAFKIVMDFSTGSYIRTIVNGKIYDLANYIMAESAPTNNLPFKVDIGCKRISANDGTRGVCSYVILTEDEP